MIDAVLDYDFTNESGILPGGRFVLYESLDLSAVTNCGPDDSNGIDLSGPFDSGDVLYITWVSGTYSVYNVSGGDDYWYHHKCRIVTDDMAEHEIGIGGPGHPIYGGDTYQTANDAYNAAVGLGEVTITGSTSYRLYINDTPTTDNSGGISLHIEVLPGS